MSNARLQRYIQRHGWNKACGFYENCWSMQLWPAQEQLINLIDAQAGESILDIASGSGLVSIPLAKAVGKQGSVIGVDISESMVELLNHRAEQLQLQQLHSQVMDCENIKFKNETFDVAVNALGLMYVTDVDESLKRMYQSLKHGGRAGILVWGARKACGWNAVFGIIDAEVESDVCPMFYRLGTGNSLELAMTQAGFVDIQLHRIRVALHYRNADEAASAVFEGGPAALPYSRFNQEIKAKVKSRYIDSVQQYKNGSGEYFIPGEFVIGIGCKNKNSILE